MGEREVRIIARIPEYAKAVVAFIAPGAVIIGSAVFEASDGGSVITQAEWITAAVACVVSAAGVAAVRNRPPQRDVNGV